MKKNETFPSPFEYYNALKIKAETEKSTDLYEDALIKGHINIGFLPTISLIWEALFKEGRYAEINDLANKSVIAIEKNHPISHETKQDTWVERCLLRLLMSGSLPKKSLEVIKSIYTLSSSCLLLTQLCEILQKTYLIRQSKNQPKSWTITMGPPDNYATEIVYVDIGMLSGSDFLDKDDHLLQRFCEALIVNTQGLIYINHHGFEHFSRSPQYAKNCSPLMWYRLTKKLELLYKANTNSACSRKLPPTLQMLENNNLWVRAGNVELRALRTYFFDVNLKTTLDSVVQRAEISKKSPNEFYQNRKDPLALDLHEINIINLFTNAGFYSASDTISQDFTMWAELYKSALTSGLLSDVYLEEIYSCSPFLHPQTSQIRTSNPLNFFKAVKDKNVLYIGSFATKINEIHRSGRLRSIHKLLGFDTYPKNIFTIESPFSIYPYHPSNGFISSLNEVILNSLSSIKSKEINIVYISAGCYGLPLAYLIWEKTGLPTISQGHESNILFGIYSNQFSNHPFIKKIPFSTGLWSTSDINERYPNYQRIDNGKYGV